jgi:hypothetical protein
MAGLFGLSPHSPPYSGARRVAPLPANNNRPPLYLLAAALSFLVTFDQLPLPDLDHSSAMNQPEPPVGVPYNSVVPFSCVPSPFFPLSRLSLFRAVQSDPFRPKLTASFVCLCNHVGGQLSILHGPSKRPFSRSSLSV